MSSRRFSLIKNKPALICTASIALLILGMFMRESAILKTSSSPNSLKYITIRGYDPADMPPLSLNPAHSDQVDNHSILNALVATLVKYGSSGKIEPYLASSWNISEDSKVWEFHLREGFFCESGEKITAAAFREKLAESFRRNLKKTDKTEFASLQGWHDFVDGLTDVPSGLRAKDNTLTLAFDRAPQSILNFLRMPYFGFWCRDNFTSKGFRDDGGFSSSGPYRLERVLSKSRVLLAMRKDQPSFQPEAPQTIEIGYGLADELQQNQTPVIAKMVIEEGNPGPEGYTPIDGPPLIFQGLVLHPNSDFFSKAGNRRAFARRLLEFQELHPENVFSKGFYLTSPLRKDEVRSWGREFSKASRKIRIALQYLPRNPASKKLMDEMFSFIFSGLDFEIVKPRPEDPHWIAGMMNNPDYDLRTASVYGGAHHVVSVIKMMFCTRLGISFPDPSGGICQLVEEYSVHAREADQAFEANFNRIVVEDAAVFPLSHARDRWLVSNTVAVETMPTSIIHPLFEKIRFK